MMFDFVVFAWLFGNLSKGVCCYGADFYLVNGFNSSLIPGFGVDFFFLHNCTLGLFWKLIWEVGIWEYFNLLYIVS